MLQALKQGEAGRIWQNIFNSPLSIARVSGEFGLRRIYSNHVSVHRGTDLVPGGSLVVRAISDARVLWAEDNEFYLEGKTVILDHGRRHYTVSANLASIDVEVGAEIGSGARLGTVGDTGSGPRLYFELRAGKDTVDPASWFGI